MLFKKIKKMGKKIDKKLKIHLKIDSGMNRIGFKEKSKLNEIYKELTTEDEFKLVRIGF